MNPNIERSKNNYNPSFAFLHDPEEDIYTRFRRTLLHVPRLPFCEGRRYANGNASAEADATRTRTVAG
jgi:hypothetical protein